MATIKDVARSAGVSVGTVSNYLSDAASLSETLRKRVASAIATLKYEPNHAARSLRSRQTKIIAMVIPDMSNPFFPQLVRGAEETAAQQGYILTTFNTDDRPEREASALSVCRARGVDGVLLVAAPGTRTVAEIKSVQQSGIPVVCLDRTLSGLHVDCVLSDNREAGKQCVLHMLSLGHRRIAFVGGPDMLCNAQDRFLGYKDAIAHAGLPVDESLICSGDFRVEGGLRAGRELLASAGRATAILVANGMMALGVLEAMEQAGVTCPGDIALACFDELAIAQVFRPRLTTVVQPTYELGQQGAALLISRITGQLSERQPVRILLESKLRVRESTLPHNGSFPEPPLQRPAS